MTFCTVVDSDTIFFNSHDVSKPTSASSLSKVRLLQLLVHFQCAKQVQLLNCKGLFTRTVSVPLSVKVTVKVYHYANGDGPFGRQVGFRTNSVCQCKFDGDCDGDGDGDGDGTCKRTLSYTDLR